MRNLIIGTGAWVALLALCGCASTVPLEQTPVASIQASLPQASALLPGEKTALVVKVLEPDGTVLLTKGAGKGEVAWTDLLVTPSIVTVDAKGMVTMPADPRVSDGLTPHLSISVPSHPGIQTNLDIPVRYDGAVTADFSGEHGVTGSNGWNGMSGMNGSTGSMDVNNPSPGGNGTDGSDGTDGGNGGPGKDALPVNVRIALRPGVRPMLQVSVSNGSRTEFFLVDPKGGTLTINVEGGAGGLGGSGGRGGSGGMGGSGSPNGSAGRDGADGRDGMAGVPGKPGAISVVFDPQVQPYLPAITFLNRYGATKSGPFPVFKEQPVAPLW